MIASFRIGRHSVTFCVAGAPRAQAERETRSGCCKRGCGFGRKRAHGYFARFAWRSSPMPMPLTTRRTSPIARSRKRFGLRAKPASDGLNLKSIACSVISLPAADRAPRRSRVTSGRSPSPAGRDHDRSNCARQRASPVSCPIRVGMRRRMPACAFPARWRRRGDRIVWTTSESGTPRQFPAQLARYADQLTIEFEHSRGGAKMKVAIIAVLLSMVSGVPAFAATFVYVSNAEDGDIGMYTLQSDGSLHSGPRFKAEKVVMPMAVSPDKRFLIAAVRSKPYQAFSYSIDPGSGALKLVGTGPLAESFPYISLDRDGRFLFGASYGANLVSVNSVGVDGRVEDPLRRRAVQ